MKAVCVSCFDYYSTRIENVIECLNKKQIKIKYLYASFNHFSKGKNTNKYRYGVKVKVPGYSKNLSFKRLYSHYLFAKKVERYIKRFQPDLIYCIIPPNYLVKVLSDYKKSNPQVKLIYDVYDMWPESFPYSKYTSLLKIPFFMWSRLRSNNIDYADLIFCVSQQGKNDIVKEVNRTKVEVLKPVIVQGDMPEYHPSEDVLSFCYLGLINHITDIDLAVNLLGRLAETKKTILHIIGEGQKLEELVLSLRNKNVEVVCHGCVYDRKKKNDIFSLCNMGLNIPRKDIHSTMSLKAVEYLRAGLPFINSAEGDIKNIVIDDKVGIDLEIQNIDGVVDKIIKYSNADYMTMHINSIESYKTRFLNQNLDEYINSIIG